MNGADLKIIPFDKEPSIDVILERAIIGSSEEGDREDRRRDTRIWDHSSKYFHANRVDPISKSLRSLEVFCDTVMPEVKRRLKASTDTLQAHTV